MFEHDRDDPALRRLTAEEGAALDATELICAVLDRADISRADLARRLGVAQSEITQRLRGRNLTVKSLAATLDALDHVLVLEAKPYRGVSISVAPVTVFQPSSRRQTSALRTTYDIDMKLPDVPAMAG
ncbi:MAG TPA: hypothetical protein VNA14_10940 [Mycobacteriales bacterium]|nr:hypothetical protein [Mycobacteriales bacterium]